MVVQEVLQRKREPWRWEAQWLAMGSWQWPIKSCHWSWSSYNYKRSCPRTQPFYGHSAFEANWKDAFWSVIFSYSTQQWTISQLDCDKWQKVDCIRQSMMTSSAAGQSSSSKALPKAKRAPKKGRGHCLVVCCLTDPL